MQPLGRRLYYGWYVLAAVASLNFANGATAIGVLTIFILPLSADFGWTRTQIAAATSIGAVLGALAAPLTGRLTDSLGARLPLTLGGALVVLATLGLATMQSLSGFYLAFGLARLADQALVQAPSPPTIAKWFHRYRGRATAGLFLVTSAGGAVLPPLVHLLITAWHWRLAWVVLSAIMLAFGLLPCLLVVRRQPEDLGLRVDGDLPAAPAGDPAPPPGGRGVAAPQEATPAWQLREALLTPGLWLLLISTFVIGFAGTGAALHLMPYLLQQGVTPAAAVGTVSLTFLASGLSNLVWGPWSDRCGARRLLVVTYALRAVSFAVLLVADTRPEAYLFAVLRGVAEGGLHTLTAVLLADSYGRRHLGAIYGLVKAAQVAGYALGPLVAGAAFDLTQTYHGAFAGFLVLSLASTVLIGFVKPPRQEQRPVQNRPSRA